MGILEGKKALIFGLANDKSIAWGISKACKDEGAQIALTYLPVMEKRVRPLADALDAKIVLSCDVNKNEDLKSVHDSIKKEWGSIDILVHSVAFAPKEEFEEGLLQTSREGFKVAMETSCYSLIAMCNAFYPLMQGREASVIAMTYYGAEKVVPHYNIMAVCKAALEASVRFLAYDLGPKKIRINAISAGPIKTLAAFGIKGFSDLLKHNEQNSPFMRTVTTEDVGNLASFLASDRSRNITGETIYVDAGYHVMGTPRAPEDL